MVKTELTHEVQLSLWWKRKAGLCRPLEFKTCKDNMHMIWQIGKLYTYENVFIITTKRPTER